MEIGSASAILIARICHLYRHKLRMGVYSRCWFYFNNLKKETSHYSDHSIFWQRNFQYGIIIYYINDIIGLQLA